MNYYVNKTVLMPIVVPDGDHCWGRNRLGIVAVCGHFDSEGGCPACTLNVGNLSYSKKTGWVEKPDKCKNFKDG